MFIICIPSLVLVPLVFMMLFVMLVFELPSKIIPLFSPPVPIPPVFILLVVMLVFELINA